LYSVPKPLDRFFGPERPPADEDRMFRPERARAVGHLWPRWLFLRGLGVWFFSAFYSLAFQVHGLIGPRGILPADTYLAMVRRALGAVKGLWYAPTLLWLGAGDAALTLVVALGIVASVALVGNVWPRVSIAVCLVAFLSFIAAAQDFASYQSDGMLLEAGFLSLFFAPRGVLPRAGVLHPPSPASLWLLRWECFRIYFESGLVKIMSGDKQWASLTAMDHYYENGPLPTWIGWYVQQRMPRGFHALTAFSTLFVELALVLLFFFPRRFRIFLFFVLSPLQIGIILTANYCFLNYLVLSLGVLLLDDGFLAAAAAWLRLRLPLAAPASMTPAKVAPWRLWGSAFVLSWVAYATVVDFLFAQWPDSIVYLPARLLSPARIANRYGLFAVMTEARYEIEFQGTRDGTTWEAYPFRYKPQDVHVAPGIYAPYQPRFEWNLWFASLADWREYPWVVRTEALLLENDRDVLSLFARNPFPGAPPARVRAVRWRYWFSDPETKEATGAWWRRKELGLYTPALGLGTDGKVRGVE
jgi:lipase maturation factor